LDGGGGGGVPDRGREGASGLLIVLLAWLQPSCGRFLPWFALLLQDGAGTPRPQLHHFSVNVCPLL
jgi:hypothetical protein